MRIAYCFDSIEKKRRKNSELLKTKLQNNVKQLQRFKKKALKIIHFYCTASFP
jgi:hypothetical protein